ncbi:MAG TPA: hypothetical protein VNY73_00880 [Bacteroidia bacterium]|jgi:hypothetical protein|nr:hypothetical protein [Bacteroidia bacterium]
MKLEQFIELVRSPAQTGEQHISSIEKIVSDYPYFQTAHLLYAKALNNSNHINYRNTLKRTAVVAGNRTVLYRLMQLPEDLAKAVAVKEEEIKTAIPPKEEKPVSNISITYDVVPSIKTENRDKTIQEPEIAGKKTTPEPELIQTEITQNETLDEVILKPVLEAYVETEVLKVTEKETPELAERSFTDWLRTVAEHTPVADNSLKGAVKNAGKEEEPQKTRSKTEKQQMLDKFINEEIRISKINPDKNFYAATEKTRSSVIENEDLVTETLAKIYRLQGNNSKAIRAYEILSLKYPEKSAYFAALIIEIKNTVK